MTLAPTIPSLSPRRAVLLIVDIQERLAAAMPRKIMAQLERNALVLAETAGHLDIPVVVSRQYPKGLGDTIASLEEALSDLDVQRLDKMAFSAYRDSAFAGILEDLVGHRRQWIVFGMETHVCVYQTVRDLIGAGMDVHVPVDAVASRHTGNWKVGIDLIARSGAIPSSTETIVFDLLGSASAAAFRPLSKRIK